MYTDLVVPDKDGLELGAAVETLGDGGEPVHAQDDLPQVLQVAQVGRQRAQAVTAEVQELDQGAQANKVGDGGDLVVRHIDLIQQLYYPGKHLLVTLISKHFIEPVQIGWKICQLILAEVHCLDFGL